MFKYSRNGVSVLVVLDRRRAKKSGSGVSQTAEILSDRAGYVGDRMDVFPGKDFDGSRGNDRRQVLQGEDRSRHHVEEWQFLVRFARDESRERRGEDGE